MNKKAKKTLVVLIVILLSVFPIIMRLYASDYSGIISKLKPGETTDSKINEIGAEILRIYTMVWGGLLVSSHIYSRYSCSNINNGR